MKNAAFFDNGAVKKILLSNAERNYVFCCLISTVQQSNDPAFCSKAKIFVGTVVWDEETDFDPDTLYKEGIPC